MSAALAHAFDDMSAQFPFPARREAADRLKVYASRLPDIDALRKELSVQHGKTVEEIVRLALPGGTKLTYQRTHVWLVSDKGEELLYPAAWKARPKPGTSIVIRVEPGKNILRTFLQIAVSIAAAAFAGPLASLFFATNTFGFAVASAAIQLGLNFAGGLLLNALFPQQRPDRGNQSQTFAATGWSNELRREGAWPKLRGQMRMAPIFAVPPVMEVVGDDVYLRTAFLWGYGPLAIPDDELKIKDTLLADYDIEQIEHRYGYPEDAPLSLITRTVLSDPLGVTLTRLYPRAADGSIEDGDPIAKPIKRRVARDATGASLILAFQRGLIRIDSKNRKKTRTVQIAIRQRMWGAESFSDVTTLEISARKETAFYREHEWTFPERGDWEIEVELLTPESDDMGVVQDVQWAVLKSFRPEYPINFPKPSALTAILIKSSNQLNGTIDQFNGRPQSICSDFVPDEEDPDAGSWVLRATSRPPALALDAIRGNTTPYPASDDKIDWPAFEKWARFCIDKDLEYNLLHDFRQPLRTSLKAIGAAGRAAVFWDGVKWTVIIDQPPEAHVGHLNARNCSQIRGRIDYLKLPHAFRVTFRDQTSGYAPKDMIVPFPGHVGPVTIMEKLDRPWITDPEQLFLDVRRYQLELQRRALSITATLRRSVRQASRGDCLLASRDLFAKGRWSGRVTRRHGNLITLSDPVVIEAGQSYWIRFLRHTPDNPLPISVLRPVKAIPGETRSLRIEGDGERPNVEDIIHLVPQTAGGMELILVGVERAKGQSMYRLKPAAPEIDAELDETVVPEWDGRTGTIVDGAPPEPAAPVIEAIESGIVGTDEPDGLIVRLRPGPGSPAVVGTFEVQHRVPGAPVWTGPVTTPAANAAVDLSGLYAALASVELRARALTYGGTAGPYVGPVTHTIGEADGETPPSIPAEAVTLTAGPGHVIVTYAHGSDTVTKSIQLYRNTGGPLDEEADAVGTPIVVEPGETYNRIVGDGTRVNLIKNPGFDTASDWTGATWTIATGTARHNPGTGGSIAQPGAVASGSVQRVAYTITAISGSAATLTPRFTGTATDALTAQTTTGRKRERHVTTSANTTFGLLASTNADVTIDNVLRFEETATSLSSGTHQFFFKPIGDELTGPVLGPITIDVD